MYRKHKFILCFIFILVAALSFHFQVDYSWIASEGITVVSIILAIYMTSFSSLISSDLGERLQHVVDCKMKNKSQLGVLKGYLSFAVLAGVINIVVSCIAIILSKETTKAIYQSDVYYGISALGMAMLAVNFTVMLFLFLFMVNRQLWNK